MLLIANHSGILTIESNLYLQPVVVMSIGLVITIVMMEITIVDVNGMEETVVVVMLTQIIVQFVNV